MEKLTKEQRKKILQIANSINVVFSWSETKQGWGYWDKIQKELIELAKEKTKCPTCGKEMEE